MHGDLDRAVLQAGFRDRVPFLAGLDLGHIEDAVYEGEENWAAVYENSSYTVVLNVVAFGGETPVVGLGVFSSPSE